MISIKQALNVPLVFMGVFGTKAVETAFYKFLSDKY
jgi:hypothetical protein